MTARFSLKATLLATCCIGCSLSTVVGTASAQTIRAWDHGDYGRAVIDWGRPVGYSVSQSDRSLDLTFDEPLASAPGPVPESLTPYVRSISQIGPDSIRLTFLQTASATAYGTDTAVIVDIRPTGEDGALAPDPSEPNRPNGSGAPGQVSATGRPAPEQGGGQFAVAAAPAPDSAPQTSSVRVPQSAASVGDRAAPEDSALRVVTVRAGVHDDYDRLVFDWWQPTDFTVQQDGATARITFDAEAEANTGNVEGRGLRRLQGVTPVRRAGGLVVDLELRPGTRVDSFSVDNRTVFDLRDGQPPDDRIQPLEDVGGTSVAERPAQIVPNPRPTAIAEPLEVSGDTQPALSDDAAFRPRPSPPRPDALQRAINPGSAQFADLTPGGGANSDEMDIAPAGRPETGPVETGPEEAGPEDMSPVISPTSERETAPPRPPEPIPEPPPQPTQAPPQTTTPPVTGADDDDLPSLEDVASSIEDTLARLDGGQAGTARQSRLLDGPGQQDNVSRQAQSARAGYGTVPRQALEVRTLEQPEGPTAVFDPGVTAYAAFFVRDGAVWAVFASLNQLNVSDLARSGEAVLGAPEVVEATGGVALRFGSANARGLHVQRNSTAWSVTLTDGAATPEVPITMVRQPNFPLGARVIAMAPGARGVVRLRDPEIGDVLMVAPVSQAGVGTPTAREFAQLEFLQSSTGLAVRPKADDIVMRLLPDGVEITADSGLVLSPDVDTRLASASRPGEGVPRYFDFTNWYDPDSSYNNQRRVLERRVVESQESERPAVRMELARLNLTLGQPHEAIGLLELVARDEPDVLESPAFLAIRGAARALSGDLDAAESDLDHDALVNSAEGYLWRGLVAERRADYADAARSYSKAGDVWSDYPIDLQIELRFSAALAALKAGDIARGHREANDLLDDFGDRVARTGAFQYLTGLIAKERGDGDRAVGWLEQATGSNDRKYAILAERELVAMQVERGDIDPEDAAERLEELRFAWRGDHLEFELLQDLGEAYWQSGAARQALATWDNATEQFADVPGAEELEDLLRGRFVQVFIGSDGEGVDVDPISQVSLYEDFRHLVPDGEIGRRIRLSLAESLAEIDLLGRSASMLEDLLADGMPSADIAGIATRLAGLRLLDRRVEDALDATALALNSDPDEQTAAQARALRARALSEIDRPMEAFRTIAEDTGDLPDATRLDIAWRSRDWDRAADALWSLIERAVPESGPLSNDQRNRIMNLALVLALSDDDEGLTEVTDRFGGQMDAGPEGEVFRVLTRSGGPLDAIDLQSIRQQVAEVDLFQSFLEDFKQSGAGLNGLTETAMN